MKIITEILSLYKQRFDKIVLEDGRTFILELEFLEQLNWWIYTLEFEDFKLTNRRIVWSPNMLAKWKNLIPFGLACYTEDQTDPAFLEDFAEGRCQLLILNTDEVKKVEKMGTPQEEKEE